MVVLPADAASGQPTRIDAGGYDVSIATGLLDQAGALVREIARAHRYAIITDSNVGPVYAERVRSQLASSEPVPVCTVPAGESSKTRESWASITDRLLASGLGRDATIVSLGGGVVCDLAGFVAATYMRGVPVVHVPTSLLAMIDASVGGKTGVDTSAGKNLVGAFHAPKAVVIDPQVLETLPLTELRAGLAEAVKHGVIGDEGYFISLTDSVPALLGLDGNSRDLSLLGRVIEKSVRLKARVVAADERENGARRTLNFGHTVGHAIELLSGFSMRHGEAVAVGMVLETRAAERAGITEAGTADRLVDTLERAGLPTRRPQGPPASRVLEVMRGDKKSRSGAIEYAVPARIGSMAGAESGYTVRLPDALVAELLA